MSDKGYRHPALRWNKEWTVPRTQNNANNSYYFNTGVNNNNKSNWYLAIPFFDCNSVTMARFSDSPMDEYVTIEQIDEAYRDCCRKKTSTDGCVRYMRNYLLNNYELYKELNTMTYEIGKSKAFCVTRPKLREVFCAQFRDRIVHHLLAIKFHDILEDEMTDNAFACRKGKGTEYGLQFVRNEICRVSDNYRQEVWVLKCDMQGFFMSINRQLLYRIVEDLFRSKYHGDDIEWWLWLWRKAIMNDPAKNCVRVGDLSLWNRLPKNKSLFTCGEGIGLPIGNLPSQILANLLLSAFDKWMLCRIGKDGGYGRYVDDFVCVSRNKEKLLEILHDARTYLKMNLGIALHPRKVFLQRVSDGLELTGAFIKGGKLYPGKRIRRHIYEAIEEWNAIESPTREQIEHFVMSINSYYGFLVHREAGELRREIWNRMQNKRYIYCVNMKKIKIINKYKI